MLVSKYGTRRHGASTREDESISYSMKLLLCMIALQGQLEQWGGPRAGRRGKSPPLWGEDRREI